MCEFLRLDESNISVAGQARRLDLYRWVAADLKAGNPNLTEALTRWRNELIARLPNLRQLQIRIPWIFVGTLQLKGQRVLIDQSNAVYVLEGQECDHYILGRKLVPGNRPS